jgi:putative transposase
VAGVKNRPADRTTGHGHPLASSRLSPVLEWMSRPRRGGRRPIHGEVISLIRQMSRANPLYGAPRIHRELLKLGLSLAQRTVAKYMVPRSRRASSQTWTTFSRKHLSS